MSCKIYGPKDFIKYFNKEVRRQKIRENLSIEDLPNGTIVLNTETRGYGVFDASGRFVRASEQYRNNNHQFIPRFVKDAPYIDEDVVFMGTVYPAFGHFLLEHMNRSHAFLRPEYKGAKVVLINNRGLTEIPQYMYDLPRLLGASDVIILNSPARFRRLIVPEQAFNLPYMMSRDFADACAIMRDNAPRAEYGDKIYMSRSALKSRRTYGEEKVQNIFAKNGFTILYPETMTITQQVSAMKNCKVLAGCGGSALHLSLFMPRGGTVIQMRRNRHRKCNAALQYLLNRACGHSSVFIATSTEDETTIHGADIPQIIGVTEDLKKFFKDAGFKYDAQDISVDEKDLAEYRAAYDAWCAEHGSTTKMWLRRKFVRFTACLIPGRVLRGRYRRWLRAKLGIAQSNWK